MAVLVSIISRLGLSNEACHRTQPNTVRPPLSEHPGTKSS